MKNVNYSLFTSLSGLAEELCLQLHHDRYKLTDETKDIIKAINDITNSLDKLTVRYDNVKGD